MANLVVVEDSPDNMKLFLTLLKMKGHDVTGLFGGEELFTTLEGKRPDLILMDLQMPDKDGWTLLKEIRASGFADLTVVALTAHAMAGDEEKAMTAGFNGYITKPIDIRNFETQVVSHIK